MKFIAAFLTILISTCGLYAQDKSFRPAYVFEGYIEAEKRQEIKLNLLVLLDSTMVGSYHYNPKHGSLNLVGRLLADNTFKLEERDAKDKITGYFDGRLTSNNQVAEGTWISDDQNKKYVFKLTLVHDGSYWHYIKKFRSLKEYRDIELAIREGDKVKSIDLAHQDLDKLPHDLKNLSNLISINLLGNNFESFPTVLTELEQMEEISLSSNKIAFVGKEIGNLKNLRILIINNNQLKSLPNELGKLENLLYLELGNNQLTSLPEDIKKLTKLQELHIERNALTDIERDKIKELLPNCVIHF